MWLKFHWSSSQIHLYVTRYTVCFMMFNFAFMQGYHFYWVQISHLLFHISVRNLPEKIPCPDDGLTNCVMWNNENCQKIACPNKKLLVLGHRTSWNFEYCLGYLSILRLKVVSKSNMFSKSWNTGIFNCLKKEITQCFSSFILIKTKWQTMIVWQYFFFFFILQRKYIVLSTLCYYWSLTLKW